MKKRKVLKSVRSSRLQVMAARRRRQITVFTQMPDHLLWGTFGLPLLTVTVPPREKETAHMNPMIGLHTSNHAHITQQGPLYPYI